MKNMMVGLIKRDSWLLLHQWRRLVVYFGSILLIDIMLVMYERSAVIIMAQLSRQKSEIFIMN